jgi:predicted RecA/RadA family phage recombinase
MGQADFRHGHPTMEDYTPGSDVAAGDVIVVGDRPMIAHTAIASGRLGALAGGGGVYNCTGDAAIAAGKRVWWNDSVNKVTETASTHKIFGFVAAGSSCAADAGKVLVVHRPGGVDLLV